MRMCKWVLVPPLGDSGWVWGQRAQTTEQPRSGAPAQHLRAGRSKTWSRDTIPVTSQGPHSIPNPALPISSRSCGSTPFLLLPGVWPLSSPFSFSQGGLDAGRTRRKEKPELWEACPCWQPLQHGRMMLFSLPRLRLVIIESCSARSCSILRLQAPLTCPSCCQPKTCEECGSAERTIPDFCWISLQEQGWGGGTHGGPPCHPAEHSQECERVTVCWEGEREPKTFPVKRREKMRNEDLR